MLAHSELRFFIWIYCSNKFHSGFQTWNLWGDFGSGCFHSGRTYTPLPPPTQPPFTTFIRYTRSIAIKVRFRFRLIEHSIVCIVLGSELHGGAMVGLLAALFYYSLGLHQFFLNRRWCLAVCLLAAMFPMVLCGNMNEV